MYKLNSVVCVLSACLHFTFYDGKPAIIISNILFLIFCHNILLWIVLVGMAKPLAALQGLKKVNELISKTMKISRD